MYDPEVLGFINLKIEKNTIGAFSLLKVYPFFFASSSFSGLVCFNDLIRHILPEIFYILRKFRIPARSHIASLPDGEANTI